MECATVTRLVLLSAAAVVAACASVTSPSPSPTPTPSLEGGRIAFERTLPGECNARIYVMNADGSDVAALTVGCDHEPAWSPDGRQIVYSNGGGGMAGPYHLYRVRADGSATVQLTDGAFVDRSPAWSPDGRRIAFARSPVDEVDADVFVINADGSGLTNLTNDPARDQGSPTWSPDGTRIAFVQTPQGAGSGDLSVMDADGTGMRSLGVDGLDPAWSPSGDRIALTGGCCAVGPWIYLIAPDGSGAIGIANPQGLDGSEPAWSPDGTTLAFVLRAGDRTEIWRMSAAGGAMWRLTGDPDVSDAAPAWR
jgi:Tol biopolymer transport system component